MLDPHDFIEEMGGRILKEQRKLYESWAFLVMISNIAKFPRKSCFRKWVHGAFILANLIDQYSIFVPCLLLAMRCCFIPFVRVLNGTLNGLETGAA